MDYAFFDADNDVNKMMSICSDKLFIKICIADKTDGYIFCEFTIPRKYFIDSVFSVMKSADSV